MIKKEGVSGTKHFYWSIVWRKVISCFYLCVISTKAGNEVINSPTLYLMRPGVLSYLLPFFLLE